MSFQFEIILGEATEFGGVWEEQDVLDFLNDEICSKNRFYKKRKIFNFHINSSLDNLKECKATRYLTHLQENYLRVMDMQELLSLHSHYEFDCGLNPIYLNQEGWQIILTYWNDRGRKSTYKVTQAYFYARNIDDARVALSIDYEGAYHPYHYDVLEKGTRRRAEFAELCKFLESHNIQSKTLQILKQE